MSHNDQLFQNIKNAREQIHRLKQEAQLLNTTNVQQQTTVKEYMGTVIYSLAKADQNVEKTYNQYKTKLPSLSVRKEQEINPITLGGYRKYRKTYKANPNKKSNQAESTRLDISANNISFSVQNRPLKFHSHHEKHMKAEVSLEHSSMDRHIIDFSIPELTVSSRKSTGHSNMRRHFRNNQSKSIKHINLNNASAIGKRVQSPQVLPRNIYENSVDKYSKHIFMIINGTLVDEGPQFSSFKRIYQSVYPAIRQNISKLQQLLREHKINFARLDGKKIAYLSLKQNPKLIQLTECLEEADEIKNRVFPRSKFQGKNGANRAATVISAFWRMFSTRRQFLNLRAKTIFLQDFFRRKNLQLKLQRQIRQKNSKIIEDFTERQQEFVRVWPKLKENKRIQIHLNSIEVEEEKRVTIQNYIQRQNIQLSRIFRLKDENLIIIFVSPNELSFDMTNYYYRMLELAGVSKYRDRLIFMHPHSAHKFPNHFSASKLLYYSSKTLKQLQTITSDIPTIIVPGHPCNQLLKLCDYLNCYLFSGEPQKMKQLGTKSQVRRFCSNLMIQILPGAMEMYDYGEFMNTFSVLMLKNPQIQTWVLKIDDQFGGRGIAYFEVNKSKYIQSLFKKIVYDQNVEFFATDIASDPQNQEITIQIRDYLKEHLCQRLKIATPTLYRSYTQFMGRFIKKGGVIEATPPCQKEYLKYPSISFCLEPHGEYSIISTYEKMPGQPFRTVACAFPQNSIDFEVANNTVREFCQSFKLRKMFGYFTVDFVLYEKEKVKKSWVVDIDPYLNNYTASTFIFDTLLHGSFFPEKNLYLVQTQEQVKDQIRSVDTTESFSEKNLSARQYVFIPHFHNPNLMKVKIKTFFKHARMERFSFDIGNKEGMCILLLDHLTSGVMGLLSVSETRQKNNENLRGMLEFIGKISQVKNVTYGKSENNAATDVIGIKEVISLFSSLSRKQQKKNGKQKALKKHQLTCKLQSII